MQQPQSPYMGGNNMPSNGYNGNQSYGNGPYGMQRAPAYGGNYKFLSFNDRNKASIFHQYSGPPQHPSLDLAGSREQRGSAFELYRKPQLGNVPVHHHNIR